jgi:hypothetical protein
LKFSERYDSLQTYLPGQFHRLFTQSFLRLQIPKAQKIQSNYKSFFALLGSTCVKAAHKLLMKLNTEAFSSLHREGKKAE